MSTFVEDRLLPHDAERIRKKIAQDQHGNVTPASRDGPFLRRGTIKHDMEDDAIVFRVIIMAVKVPFCHRAVDLHIADEPRFAAANAGSPDIGSGVEIQTSGVFNDNSAPIDCAQSCRAEILIVPNVSEKALVDTCGMHEPPQADIEAEYSLRGGKSQYVWKDLAWSNGVLESWRNESPRFKT